MTATTKKAKSKRHSRFHDYLIPKVANRLNIPPHELRRAVHRGEVETFMWGGRHRISPAEEARIAALLQENAA